MGRGSEFGHSGSKPTALVEKAAGEGAKIIVLPEGSITGCLSQDLRVKRHVKGRPLEPPVTGKDPQPYAEEVPGAFNAAF
jgi:hypothetical protein